MKGKIILNGKSFSVEFYPMNLLQTKREEVNTVQDWLCDKVIFLSSVPTTILLNGKNATNVTILGNPTAEWFTMEPPLCANLM